MKLKWDTNPEYKFAWNTEIEKDAPREYRQQKMRECYGGYTRGRPSGLRPRYVKPHYELGIDEESQLRSWMG